jgi:hypothetical protein
MHLENLGVVLRLGLTLFAIFATVQLLLLPALADGFRQRIFALRRGMFLYMAEGHVRSDEPAYVEILATMNGLLRFAERLTIMRLVISQAFNHNGRAYAEKMAASLQRVESPDVREKLQNYRTRIGEEVIRHIILVSPIVWPLVGVLIVRILLSHKDDTKLPEPRSAARRAIQGVSVEGIEADAEAFGCAA